MRNNADTNGRAAVKRMGDRVQRPAGSFTPHVHALLRHMRARGFLEAPEPLGFDDAHEMVSFVAGEVGHDPLAEPWTSPQLLTSAARLLRRYHDATVNFLEVHDVPDDAWMLPPRTPREVMCHGDFAQYNVVLRDSKTVAPELALIDFDTVHPGSRGWDIAYAIYRWAPLMHPLHPECLGSLEQQLARARLFCDAYGFAHEQRKGLGDVVVARLEELVTFMTAAASRGNATFAAHLAAGHHRLYAADIAYLRAHRGAIAEALEQRAGELLDLPSAP